MSGSNPNPVKLNRIEENPDPVFCCIFFYFVKFPDDRIYYQVRTTGFLMFLKDLEEKNSYRDDVMKHLWMWTYPGVWIRRQGRQGTSTDDNFLQPRNSTLNVSWTFPVERVSFHSNLKERQSQRMLKLPHNYTHLTL